MTVPFLVLRARGIFHIHRIHLVRITDHKHTESQALRQTNARTFRVYATHTPAYTTRLQASRLSTYTSTTSISCRSFLRRACPRKKVSGQHQKRTFWVPSSPFLPIRNACTAQKSPLHEPRQAVQVPCPGLQRGLHRLFPPSSHTVEKAFLRIVGKLSHPIVKRWENG